MDNMTLHEELYIPGYNPTYLAATTSIIILNGCIVDRCQGRLCHPWTWQGRTPSYARYRLLPFLPTYLR
jgi:hypothetical protein